MCIECPLDLKAATILYLQQRRLVEAEQGRFSLVAIMDEKAKWLIAGALAVAAGVALYSVVGRVSSKSQDGTGKSSPRVAPLAVPPPPKPKRLA